MHSLCKPGGMQVPGVPLVRILLTRRSQRVGDMVVKTIASTCATGGDELGRTERGGDGGAHVAAAGHEVGALRQEDRLDRRCDNGSWLQLAALPEQLLVLVAGERAFDEPHELVTLETKLTGHRRQVLGAAVGLAVAHHSVDARLDVRPRLMILAWMEVTQLP